VTCGVNDVPTLDPYIHTKEVGSIKAASANVQFPHLLTL
jgi:hypothetical protein